MSKKNKNKKNKKNKLTKAGASLTSLTPLVPLAPCCCREVEVLSSLRQGVAEETPNTCCCDAESEAPPSPTSHTSPTSPTSLETEEGSKKNSDLCGYTPQGEHPEDRIFKDKTFINRLGEVQNTSFEKLVQDLNLNQDGSDLLFDYVYNEDHDLSFDEWLDKLGRSYQNLVNR